MESRPVHPQVVERPRRSGRPRAELPLPLGMALVGCEPGVLDVLRKITLAIVGCGSVGGRIAVSLARTGVGGLLLVDPKSYKPGSLATQDINPGQVGQPKALSVARRCKAISPTARVRAVVGPVENLDLAELAEVDVVVMAPDRLSVELVVGQRCLWLGKPLMQASVHGASLTAQIRFWANAKGGAGGCPACGWASSEWDLMNRQAPFSCGGASETSGLAPAEAPATNSLSALCSLAADLAVIQVLRHLVQLGEPVENTLVEYCGFTHRTVVSPLDRNPKCPLDHTTLAQVVMEEPLHRLSLAQVLHRTMGRAVGSGVVYEVAGLDWIELAACGCAQPTPVRRFVPRGQPGLSSCPRCSTGRTPLSFHTYRAIGASVLGSAAEVPLQRLGARPVASVLVRAGDAGVLVRPKPATPATP
jgi:molybdopterin/thiamine biosynthesis adenylyltransferase